MIKQGKKAALVLLASLFMMQTAVAKVTVFAAASMTNALQQVAEDYKKQHPQQEIEFSFASSSVLAKQIDQGAPADIFLSANVKWMDFLTEKKALVENSKVILVKNGLVMIAPKASQVAKIDLTNAQWQQHLAGSYLAVGDPAHVPAGIYAKAALTNLGQWDAVENKLARANNVRAALALVEQGESPLGIVYSTDAQASQKVKVVATFPQNSYKAIEYPLAIVKDQDNQEVRAFYDYLKSAPAKKVLMEYGFITE